VDLAEVEGRDYLAANEGSLKLRLLPSVPWHLNLDGTAAGFGWIHPGGSCTALLNF
jgi:hypothetical protein